MNKTEMRMLRWIQSVSLRDHIRNKEIRKAVTVQPITTHMMQKRLRWYGHARRRDDDHKYQNSAGHGGRRCETQRKTNIKTHGHHQKRYEEGWADGR